MSVNLLANLDVRALTGIPTPEEAKSSQPELSKSPLPPQKEQSTQKAKAANTDTQSIRVSLPSTLVRRLALLRIAGTSRNNAVQEALELYLDDPEVKKIIAQVSKSLK